MIFRRAGFWKIEMHAGVELGVIRSHLRYRADAGRRKRRRRTRGG